MIYVGETERTLEDRFKEHLGYVNNGHLHRPTGAHFSSPGHSVSDMSVCILWKVYGDIVDRKSLESWFIFYLNTRIPFGINRKS